MKQVFTVIGGWKEVKTIEKPIALEVHNVNGTLVVDVPLGRVY